MFKISNEAIYTILFYVSILYILHKLNLKIFLDKNNNIKKFGLNNNETLFNIYVVSFILSIIFNIYLISNC